MDFIDIDGIIMDYRDITHWTGCPHYQHKTKVKSLEFYEDVIKRVVMCKLEIKQGDTRQVFIGAANCHPRDKYDVEVGQKIALSKTIANFSKEQRSIVWKYYFRKIAKE